MPVEGRRLLPDVDADAIALDNAAWTYRHPSPFARRVKDRVAFEAVVEVVEL